MDSKNIFDHSNIINAKNDDGKQFKKAIETINNICIANGIPYFLTFAKTNDESGTSYKNYFNFPVEQGIELTDDKFRNYLLVYRGAKVHGLDTLSEFNDDDMEYILGGADISPDQVFEEMEVKSPKLEKEELKKKGKEEKMEDTKEKVENTEETKTEEPREVASENINGIAFKVMKEI